MVAGYHDTKGDACDGEAEPEQAVQKAEIRILTCTPNGTAGRTSLLNRLAINSVAYMGHGC